VGPAPDELLVLAHARGLLDSGPLATARRRHAALRAAGAAPPLLDWLVEQGLLDAWALARLLAETRGLPTVEVAGVRPEPAALAALPPSWARHFQVLPLSRSGSVLRAAISDPLDEAALDGVGQVCGLAVEPAIAPAEEIRQAIERCYADAPGAAAPAHGAAPAEFAEGGEGPVIRLVEDLFRRALARGASDLHVEPGPGRLRVRLRVDGVLEDVEEPPPRWRRAIVARLKLLAELDIAEKRLPQDGKARLRLDGRCVDLRVSILPSVHGEAAAVRLLDPERVRHGLGELGMAPDARRDLEALLALPDGIVLVTGPTGSGKSTTLYACLEQLRDPGRKIITVEDPVECELPGINQVSVRPAVGLTFAAALRAMLRQAPNVILVGEIRDRETAEMALTAALTGHLVLSTLHTNDAPGAIARLLDLGLERFLVASALRAVIAQRLVRRACPRCARGAGGPAGAVPGCPDCGGSGYRGRIGIFEFLRMDERLRAAIHGGAGLAELRAAARANGLQSLREDGLRQVRAGLTTLEVVLAETADDAKGL